MSDKQQSPIAKAIAWCDEVIAKGDTYRPFIINVKAMLIPLLEEERQFAENAYNAGAGHELWQGHDEDREDKGDFTNFFKQYEP